MNDWEENPDAYMRDDNGDFILKKDGTPRKKTGRPKGSSGRGYNYHSETKAKIDARKTVRKKEKRLAQVRTKLENYKRSLDTSKSTLNKLEGTEAKSEGKITTTSTDDLPKALRTVAEENVIFKPNTGPQTDFLAASETDVLYGGAAGGGKSYAMLVDPLRYAHRAAHRALILRRSMPELRELIDKSRELYPKAFPGCNGPGCRTRSIA